MPCQAINWINEDLIYWVIYTSSRINGLLIEKIKKDDNNKIKGFIPLQCAYTVPLTLVLDIRWCIRIEVV